MNECYNEEDEGKKDGWEGDTAIDGPRRKEKRNDYASYSSIVASARSGGKYSFVNIAHQT